MQKYRYQDFHGEHSHQICVDGSWRPLIGTSRVGSVLSKPFAWYGSGKAVEAFGCPDAKVLTKIKNRKATAEEKQKHMDAMKLSHRALCTMSWEQFADLVDTAYRAHDTYKKARAPIGKDLHAELERFVKDHMRGEARLYHDEPRYDAKINPFIEWSNENVKRFIWSEGHNYSELNWVGGICDAGYEKHDGTFGIIDFKSSKEAYFEHFAQIAGYDINISENGVLTADGDLIYTLEKPISEYCVLAFGADKPKPQFNFDQVGMRDVFLHMLAIYKKLPQD